MTENTETHKYLDDCGFNLSFQNGELESKSDTITSSLTKEQYEDIQNYMYNLLDNVKSYIELHYWENK